jgi:hypothetical protein
VRKPEHQGVSGHCHHAKHLKCTVNRLRTAYIVSLRASCNHVVQLGGEVADQGMAQEA